MPIQNWLKRVSAGDTRDSFFYLRVDDRLIHGQVVIGWGASLDVNCLILANDRVAQSPSESALYLQIIPESMGGRVLTVAQALQNMSQLRAGNNRCIIVVSSVEDALRWVQSGHAPDLLILGGVHDSERRRRVLDYLYLTEEEIESLRDVARRGVKIICRDLPTSEAIDLEKALSRSG